MDFVWQLPVVSSERDTHAEGYIHGLTKLHLFNTLTTKSYCGKYRQQTANYECYYEKTDNNNNFLKNTFSNKDQCCKKCYKKYEQIKGITQNET